MIQTKRVIGYMTVALGLSWALYGGPPSEKSITLPPDNPVSELKPGLGVEKARANCIACHSTDYIVRQPGRDAKQWEAEVEKMVTVFGAPINEGDAKVIVEYLATVYGPRSKAPPPKTRAPSARR